MTDADAKRHGQRLLDDLALMGAAGGRRCGLGLIVLGSAPGPGLPRPEDWEFLERLGSFEPDHQTTRFTPAPIRYDPAPDGRSCLRWSGNETRVERLQDWGDRTSAYLRTSPDRPDDEEIGPGYHGLFDALVRVARADDELAAGLYTKTVLDTAALSERQRQALPAAYRRIEHPAVFRFAEAGYAEPFVEAAFRRLLAPPPKPKLTVDVTTGVVWFDGKFYTVKDIHAHILSELLQARDRPINSAEMRGKNKLLSQETRIPRLVDWIRKTLGIPIIGSTDGYRLPDDCLA